jgi:Holliday junction resolvase RusA-like endonuclease
MKGTDLAPIGQVFVCGACGKTSRTRYGYYVDEDGHSWPTAPDGQLVASPGWDESCLLHAVLCFEEKTWDGKWRAVEEKTLVEIVGESRMKQTLWIPGPLPGLNDVINAKRSRWGGQADGYSAMKKKWNQKIALAARAAGLRPVEAAHFTYEIREVNKRRDPSNLVSAVLKLCEDGLQAAGVLTNDGWKQVLGYTVRWCVSPNPGVMVVIEDVEAKSA